MSKVVVGMTISLDGYVNDSSSSVASFFSSIFPWPSPSGQTVKEIK
jgi:hypothetical protein